MKMLTYFILASSLMACGSKEASQVAELIDSTYVTRGNAIAKISFETISGELKEAIQSGGIEYALKYCNENAYPLTDSLAQTNQVTIKRVSNRNRNLRNKADKMEEFLIQGFGNDLNTEKEITPRLVLKDDSVIFYKAIITQPMCLTCHGKVEKELAFSTDTLIRRLYPRDKAIGYEVNQIRGLWRIGFKKN
ncbi:MAG: DUF3365 domain-containing protein [Flammeovirgaceae bacterium]|jgi:hypothetical protein|nr:DUF3365 domain-containing protein [Flammeovirgaceae bacterium]